MLQCGGKEAAGIGLLWVLQNGFSAAAFNHFAVFHYQNLVRHRADDTQIMTDENIRQSIFFLQPPQ